MNNIKKTLGIGALVLGLTSCSSDGYLGSGVKGNLEQYTIEHVDQIGGGALTDGIGLAAMSRDPSDSLYGQPHFYVAIRAKGATKNKIIIYDVDTGKPVQKMIVDDK